MGSEFYAYFVVDSERISSTELEELARDAGVADLPSAQVGIQVTARLGAESKLKQGGEAELWFDSRHLHMCSIPSQVGTCSRRTALPGPRRFQRWAPLRALANLSFYAPPALHRAIQPGCAA